MPQSNPKGKTPRIKLPRKGKPLNCMHVGDKKRLWNKLPGKKPLV